MQYAIENILETTCMPTEDTILLLKYPQQISVANSFSCLQVNFWTATQAGRLTQL